MLYFNPTMKKHYGKAVEDLALAKTAATVKSVRIHECFFPHATSQARDIYDHLRKQGTVRSDVFGGGDWGASESESASPIARGASASPTDVHVPELI